jgi:hypothetical protein
MFNFNMRRLNITVTNIVDIDTRTYLEPVDTDKMVSRPLSPSLRLKPIANTNQHLHVEEAQLALFSTNSADSAEAIY